MKLVRYGRPGAEKPGLIGEDGAVRDLSRVVKDITPEVLSPLGLKRLHVAAYCIVDDVSERAFQMEHGGTTTKGKSADTFAPIGPWLVTADEVRDPQSLEVWTTVNGESRQRGNTANMIFPVRQLVAYVSRFMSLRAGDIISTGTPAGVAHGMKPPRYLQPGDVVAMGITGLGEQKNRVVSR